MVSKFVRVYIEGGGQGRASDHEFRSGWRKFLSELNELARTNGFQRLEIIRGKGRARTFKLFKGSPTQHPNDLCVLIVDSEVSVSTSKKVWDVVGARSGDGWARPTWADEKHLYLMVQSIETWLVSDSDALKKYFGPKLDVSKLPSTNLETRSKVDIERALENATKSTPRGCYSHIDAVKVMPHLNPLVVRSNIHHCNRLFFELSSLISV